MRVNMEVVEVEEGFYTFRPIRVLEKSFCSPTL